MESAGCEEFMLDICGGSVYVKKWLPLELLHSVPVVLLHDSLGCVGLWRDFPGKLALHLSRPVIAYDRLGFGQSSAREALPGMDFIWEEAEIYFPAVKTALKLEQYALFGHSVGGAMALAISAQDARCDAVITAAAQAFVDALTLAGVRDAQVQFQQPGQIEKLQKWHGKKGEWVLRAWTEIWLSSEFSSWSLTPCIGKVRCPVLAIHGDKDEYGTNAFPEFISGKSGGDAEIAILQDCGHFPHRDKLPAVLAYTKSFFEKHRIG